MATNEKLKEAWSDLETLEGSPCSQGKPSRSGSVSVSVSSSGKKTGGLLSPNSGLGLSVLSAGQYDPVRGEWGSWDTPCQVLALLLHVSERDHRSY